MSKSNLLCVVQTSTNHKVISEEGPNPLTQFKSHKSQKARVGIGVGIEVGIGIGVVVGIGVEVGAGIGVGIGIGV